MTAQRIPPEDAHRLMSEGYAYLDVRSQPEFENGHPTGAYNVPLLHMGPSGLQPNPHFLEVVKANFPTDAKIIVGCKMGGRSLKASAILMEAGYPQVLDQSAGFNGSKDAFGQLVELGWKPKTLPVSLQADVGRSYEELAMKAGKEPPPRVTKSGRIIGPDGAEPKT